MKFYVWPNTKYRLNIEQKQNQVKCYCPLSKDKSTLIYYSTLLGDLWKLQVDRWMQNCLEKHYKGVNFKSKWCFVTEALFEWSLSKNWVYF